MCKTHALFQNGPHHEWQAEMSAHTRQSPGCQLHQTCDRAAWQLPGLPPPALLPSPPSPAPGRRPPSPRPPFPPASPSIDPGGAQTQGTQEESFSKLGSPPRLLKLDPLPDLPPLTQGQALPTSLKSQAVRGASSATKVKHTGRPARNPAPPLTVLATRALYSACLCLCSRACNMGRPVPTALIGELSE